MKKLIVFSSLLSLLLLSSCSWKPEKEIYKQVEATIGLERSEFIFIDDNSNNVIGAKELGWQAYLHPTNTDLRLTLNNAGIGI